MAHVPPLWEMPISSSTSMPSMPTMLISGSRRWCLSVMSSSEQQRIPSEVWLDRRDAVEEWRAGDGYCSPSKRAFQFRRRPSHWKFRKLVDSGAGREARDGRHPCVVQRGFEVVDCVAGHVGEIVDEGLYTWEVVLDRLGRDVVVDLDGRSDYVWEIPPLRRGRFAGISSPAEVGHGEQRQAAGQ